MIIENINESDILYLQKFENKNSKSILGIKENFIAEIKDFVDSETAKNMINFFEAKAEMWGDIAFYGSLGMGLAPNDPLLKDYNLSGDHFDLLRDKFKEAVELSSGRKVKPNTSHAQKWDEGGFAAPHSDNSDFDGNPNAFEINKYVGILYLNDNYDGGELYFVEEKSQRKNEDDHPEWNEYLSFKPNAYSFIIFPGGVENVHGVKEIIKGTRYTMVSFWDYEEAEYDQETLDRWDAEEKEIRKQQALQKEEWAKGNKYA
ncbi:2OG-Fe(II) oxygenase [bacterium]|nr:2OG-Fe(II) oxygenase [Candidatus Elulimicrobium humile]